MENLWAPWRHAYIALNKPEKGPECFICAGKNTNNNKQNLLVHKLKQSLIFLNKYPYNNGHLLICPHDHFAELGQLNESQLLSNIQTIQHLIKVLKNIMNPDGFNIGMNHGASAGAGVPGHLHWHLVPRWNGDTNFMPVLTDTKVIVQSLDSFYDLLVKNLEADPFPDLC